MFIAGAGPTTHALLRALADGWSVGVADADPLALASLPQHPGLTTVQGDPTSRLVLGRCRLRPTSTVVALLPDDEANTEVLRLVRDSFSVVDTLTLLDGPPPEALAGGDALDRASVLAQALLQRIDHIDLPTSGAEVITGALRQVILLDGSPAIDRPIADLAAQGWLIAAAWRKGELVVPRGSTRLQAGDRVLLVGEPAQLMGIVDMFRGGAPTFPAGWGTTVRLRDAAAAPIARLLTQHTLAHDVEGPEGPASAEPVGCIVATARPIRLLARLAGLADPAWDGVVAGDVPVWLHRGASTPIKRILLAVPPRVSAGRPMFVALDLARQLEASLTLLTVSPMAFLSEPDPQHARHLDTIRRMAIARGVDPTVISDEGNPVERIRHHAREHDLVVIGHRAGRRSTWLDPDISLLVAHNCACDTLLVPTPPEGAG